MKIFEILIHLIKLLLSFPYNLYNMSKKSSKYYAVSTGRSTGIFTSWGNAQKQVIGYKGAVYRRYPTLDEALQDMQVNGHSDPPIFNHREVEIVNLTGAPNSNNINVQVRPSQSDSELSFKVSYAPILPNETPENELVLEIEHPEIDIQQIFTSQSSTELVTAPSPDTSPKKLLYSNTTTPSNSEPVDDHDMLESTSSSNEKVTSSHTQTDYVYATTSTKCAVEISSIDNIHQKCDLLNDKVNQLETKLQQQIDLNKEILSSFLTFQKEQASINIEKDKKMDEMKTLLEEIASSNHQTQNAYTSEKYDELLTGNSKLLKEVSDVESCQKSQHSMILNALESSKATQQIMIQLQEKMNTVLCVHNDYTQSAHNTNKEDKPLEKNVTQAQSDYISTQNSTFASNSASKSEEDFENKDIIQHHSELARQRLNDRNDNKNRTFHLHDKDAKNVLFGDSNMRSINRQRLDSKKETEVRTFKGASINSLKDIISTSKTTYPKVEKVTICIGSVDCARRYIDGDTTHNDYLNLISTIKSIFTSAEIAIVSIPPQRNPQSNKAIKQVNHILKTLARNNNCTFCDCESLWLHVDKDNFVDNGILIDHIHLTSWGIGLLLRPIINFFFRKKDKSQTCDIKDPRNSKSPSPPQSYSTKKSIGFCESQSTFDKETRILSDHIAQSLTNSIFSFVQKSVAKNWQE